MNIEQLAEDLYCFPIALPNNPLKSLNCYVIKPQEGRCLLVDSGFNRPECAASLLSGIRELGLVPENTDVFFTHLHADHTGNGALLKEMGFTIYMSRIDQEVRLANTLTRLEPRFRLEGMSDEILQRSTSESPARRFAPGHFVPVVLEAGDELSYGGHRLECVLTPGHTPGHMCLYDRTDKTMFLGDHVLFDITPNVCVWPDSKDSLGDYLENLRAVKEYEVIHPLPAHRGKGAVSFAGRIDQLLAHHESRLNEAYEIILRHPGITAYDTAGHMTWKVRGGSGTWAEFPSGQRWFAVGEAIAHIDHLTALGRIRRIVSDDGRAFYEAAE